MGMAPDQDKWCGAAGHRRAGSIRSTG